MFARILVLFALPALAGAGTIVQSGSLFDDNASIVYPFDLQGEILTAVEARFTIYGFDWQIGYSFGGDSGIPLNPSARVTSAAAASIEITLPPGWGWMGAPTATCESLIPETGDGYMSCTGGGATYDWVGDPGDPRWTQGPLGVGYAVATVLDVQCEPGTPAIPCYASVSSRPGVSAGYELTYHYVAAPPPAEPIPEPSPAALLAIPLALIALSPIRRSRRQL